jgi:hypothetical protein
MTAVSRSTAAHAGRRTRALLFLACLALAGGVHAEPLSTARFDEYRVKAAILYNIARFVEWPSAAFPNAGAPLVVCVLGVDPFGALLEDTLLGRTVAGRPVTIRRLQDVGDGCHVAFIAYSEQKRVGDILDRLGSGHVLSISDVDRFIDRGGVVGLTTEGDRVRFHINAAAVERASLIVNARVMALASSVRRRGGPAR